MTTMKKTIITLVLIALFMPFISSASPLAKTNSSSAHKRLMAYMSCVEKLKGKKHIDILPCIKILHTK